METLLVFADFDFIDSPALIGELGYESLRGSDSYSFRFDESWLRAHADLQLSADLNNYPGWQYTRPDRDIFGCFSDALPVRRDASGKEMDPTAGASGDIARRSKTEGRSKR